MKKYFLKDKTLNNIDDDQFRYQDFANNLRKIIECNEAPFNIAVIGKWGLGKSSLVNMALASLRNKKKDFLIVDINAWKYEKEEIGKAFLKKLWEGISEKDVLSFHFFHKEYSKIIEEMFNDKPVNLKKNEGLYNFCKYSACTFVASVLIFPIYCAVSNDFYGVNLNSRLFAASTFLRYCKNIGSIFIIPIVVWLGKLFMDKLNEPAYKKYDISFPLETQADYEIYLKNLLRKYYETLLYNFINDAPVSEP
ncbi:MAG: KAP family NTPase, partial [Eubacterium sp.]|nr:KAP family NTPase [Eubacterium sp.]